MLKLFKRAVRMTERRKIKETMEMEEGRMRIRRQNIKCEDTI